MNSGAVKWLLHTGMTGSGVGTERMILVCKTIKHIKRKTKSKSLSAKKARGL